MTLLLAASVLVNLAQLQCIRMSKRDICGVTYNLLSTRTSSTYYYCLLISKPAQSANDTGALWHSIYTTCSLKEEQSAPTSPCETNYKVTYIAKADPDAVTTD